MALVGANGAGKSTLLHMIIGNQQCEYGQVALQGRLGYMPQLLSSPGITVRLLLAETAGEKRAKIIKLMWQVEEQLKVEEDNIEMKLRKRGINDRIYRKWR